MVAPPFFVPSPSGLKTWLLVGIADTHSGSFRMRASPDPSAPSPFVAGAPWALTASLRSWPLREPTGLSGGAPALPRGRAGCAAALASLRSLHTQVLEMAPPVHRSSPGGRSSVILQSALKARLRRGCSLRSAPRDAPATLRILGCCHLLNGSLVFQ